MKIIIFLFLLFIPAYLFGQAVTEKNQSVSVNILGVEYNYEQPLNNKFTVSWHGGLAGELGYSVFKWGSWYEDSGWMYSVRGKVGADFRYYYNLAKREMKGKNTRMNTGNFWAVNISYFTPAIVAKRVDDSYIVMASPYWGIRRVYKSNLFFEFNIGLNVAIIGGEWGIGRLTNAKLGYVF